MSEGRPPLQIPRWFLAVIAFGFTAGGLAVGGATATWKAAESYTELATEVRALRKGLDPMQEKVSQLDVRVAVLEVRKVN